MKEVDNTQSSWGKLANLYREFREIGGKFNKDDKARIGEYPYMLSLLEQTQIKNKSVLDVGCGFGFYTLLLERMGATHIEGVDFSPEMIQLALDYKVKNKSMANFSVARAEALPFPSNSFDVITSGMAIDVENLDLAFSELSRVLTPNGIIIFSVPHPTKTHGKYDENGKFVFGDYFTSDSYVSTWSYDKDVPPVTFNRPNKKIEDYTEALYKNHFVLRRLFESKPIFNEGDDSAKRLEAKMISVPTYLIISAEKTGEK